mmetsp:Transcript_11264/g.28503  ORF Transcript_11264/g.28503 Transcript_11264/m.28503 type:complete len:249 (-) Transcript_11264:547-1293(-)
MAKSKIKILKSLLAEPPPVNSDPIELRNPIVNPYGEFERATESPGSTESHPSRVVAKRMLPVRMRVDKSGRKGARSSISSSALVLLVVVDLDSSSSTTIAALLLTIPLKSFLIFRKTAAVLGDNSFPRASIQRGAPNETLFRTDRYCHSSTAGRQIKIAASDDKNRIALFPLQIPTKNMTLARVHKSSSTRGMAKKLGRNMIADASASGETFQPLRTNCCANTRGSCKTLAAIDDRYKTDREIPKKKS